MSNRWEQVDSTIRLAQISVGNSYNVWGVDPQKNVYRWQPNGWEAVAGQSLVQVAVGTDGTVVGISDQNRIWRYQGGGRWERIRGALKQVSVGNCEHLWGVNPVGIAHRWDGQDWERMGARIFASIAVGAEGTVWGLDCVGGLFEYHGDDEWIQVDQAFSAISVGQREHVWGIRGGIAQAYLNSGSGQAFVDYGGTDLTTLSVGADGAVWALDRQGKTFKLELDLPTVTYEWQAISDSRRLQQVAVGNRTNIWAVDQENDVFVWNGGNWEFVHGRQMGSVVAAADGTVLGLGTDGKFYAWEWGDYEWEEMPGFANPRRLSVGGAEHIWGTDQAYNVYRFQGQSKTWQRVGGQPLRWISVGADGTAWGTDGQQNVYQYQGAESWRRVGLRFLLTFVGNADHLLGLDAKGRACLYGRIVQATLRNPTLISADIGSDGTTVGIDGNGRAMILRAVEKKVSTQGLEAINSGALFIRPDIHYNKVKPQQFALLFSYGYGRDKAGNIDPEKYWPNDETKAKSIISLLQEVHFNGVMLNHDPPFYGYSSTEVCKDQGLQYMADLLPQLKMPGMDKLGFGRDAEDLVRSIKDTATSMLYHIFSDGDTTGRVKKQINPVIHELKKVDAKHPVYVGFQGRGGNGLKAAKAVENADIISFYDSDWEASLKPNVLTYLRQFSDEVTKPKQAYLYLVIWFNDEVMNDPPGLRYVFNAALAYGVKGVIVFPMGNMIGRFIARTPPDEPEEWNLLPRVKQNLVPVSQSLVAYGEQLFKLDFISIRGSDGRENPKEFPLEIKAGKVLVGWYKDRTGKIEQEAFFVVNQDRDHAQTVELSFKESWFKDFEQFTPGSGWASLKLNSQGRPELTLEAAGAALFRTRFRLSFRGKPKDGERILGKEYLRLTATEQDYNLKDYSGLNDHIWSILFEKAPKGLVVSVYDSPEGKMNDDYTIVETTEDDVTACFGVEGDVEEKDSQKLRWGHLRKNGLEDKISRIKVETDGPHGCIYFQKKDDASDSYFVKMLASGGQSVNLKDFSGLNDEVAKGILTGLRRGTVITVFDDPEGKWTDDYTIIEVHTDIVTELALSTFEESRAQDPNINMAYMRYNGLNQKISHVRIDDGGSYGMISFLDSTNVVVAKMVALPGQSVKLADFRNQSNTSQSLDNKISKAILHQGLRQGTTIQVFKDAAGGKGKDYAELYVKNDLTRQVEISSFEADIATADVRLLFVPVDRGGLDGRIGHIKIDQM